MGGRVQRIERLVPFEVKGWIGARARLHGVVVQPDAMDALAFALGPDTERIENEVQKLGAFAGGAPVTAADVHALVSGAIESDIFELTKAVVQRNHRAAVPLLERLPRRWQCAPADPRAAPVAVPRSAFRLAFANEPRRREDRESDPVLARRDLPVCPVRARREPRGTSLAPTNRFMPRTSRSRRAARTQTRPRCCCACWISVVSPVRICATCC
jgi:hypothetical protein